MTTSALFGRLTLDAIPYQNPIIMGTVGTVTVLGVLLVAWLTYQRRWAYLWNEWFTSVDHKRIGVMYIIFSVIMMLRGFADAIMMRTHQALAQGMGQGYLPPEHYDQIFSAHGTIMIIFVAMPFFIGLMNFVVPLQIGARDVAYPFLNSVSFWLTVASGLLVMVSLAVGDFSQAGWSGYPPYSELKFSPSTGVDYWMWSLQLGGIGTLVTGINFFVTILRMRAPGMSLMKMPIFTWTIFVTTVLIMFSFPVLTVTLALLAMDRYFDMHFFTNDFGGNQMMFANLFWIWGHPEVYIVVLPAFGIFSEVVSTFSKKRLFGYASMVYATIAIAILSFVVWLHHFFTMGSGANVNAFFGIATMIIAVPTGVKVFNWLFTMYRGRIEFTTAMMWSIGFIITFAVGGMTGVLLAVPGADFMLHNSEFLVAHFHNMLIPGALFGYFAGYNFWFPKMFGFRLDEKWGKRSFWSWLVGFYLAFMPLYALGFMGMPRRMSHYDNPYWQPYLIVALLGTFLIAFGIFSQIMQLAVSIRQRHALRDRTGDIWGSHSLEWSIPSPPAFYNFAKTPVVEDLYAFTYMKENGINPRATAPFAPIHMPRNSSIGVFLGLFTFTLGFGLVWHMWWLVVGSLFAILSLLVMRSTDDNVDYELSPQQVAVYEAEAYQSANQASGQHAADLATQG
ncbi:cytochrome o ubiquinol oxidase subunit I [Ferrovum sp. PN-J185]|uniref:cytochrome o ubiquinol oxidase subunit I n=1 Tax=Ferrovum sp. PN-J185 TaxID=1356306 RepID=UPI001E6511E3|nr:cytochrome o ubiquinol oxidase subunit I [Ferrovum sp. PN-J185]MCC6067663.1 cytochrome o ubiquinol oxidase subunit I [Ferrovum sp. PN-J185]